MKQTVFFSTFLFLLLLSCKKNNTSDYAFEDAPIIIDMDSAKTDTLKINHIIYIPMGIFRIKPPYNRTIISSS